MARKCCGPNSVAVQTFRRLEEECRSTNNGILLFVVMVMLFDVNVISAVFPTDLIIQIRMSRFTAIVSFTL